MARLGTSDEAAVATRISVVVTTYNHAQYIAEALDSVLSQTLPASEIIVVDDGSTDDTRASVEPFTGRVVYIRQRNQGVAGARNTGIARARGDWIAFLDGDDVWEAGHLAALESAARAHPDAGLITVDGVQFGAEGLRRDSLLVAPLRATDDADTAASRVVHGDFYRAFLGGKNPIGTTSQVMIRAAVFRTVGVSDTRLPLASDFDLYLRISARYPVVAVRERLTRYRYHPASASGPADVRVMRWDLDIISALKKQRGQTSGEERVALKARIREALFRTAQAAYYYGRLGHRGWATVHLFRVWKRNPSSLAVPAFLAALWWPAQVNAVLGAWVRRIVGPRAGSSSGRG